MTPPDSGEREMPDPLRRLTHEELAQVPPITKEQMDAALEQGMRDREVLETRCGGNVPYDQWPIYLPLSLAQRILAALEEAVPLCETENRELIALAAELRSRVPIKGQQEAP